MFGKKETEKRSLEDMFVPNEAEYADFDENVLIDEPVEVENNDELVKNDCCEKEAIKPLDCFGMEDGKTDKWLCKLVKIWFCCMSLMWFLFGAITFAPMIFIGNKVNVVFKDKKKSFFCGAVIHVLLLALIILFCFF